MLYSTKNPKHSKKFKILLIENSKYQSFITEYFVVLNSQIYWFSSGSGHFSLFAILRSALLSSLWNDSKIRFLE